MDGWPAQYISRNISSYMGIPAQCILALGILALGILVLGIRIQLTAGGWGWRRLADGCYCEGAA